MVKKFGKYKVPFDKNGNLLHYASRYDEVSWVDNSVFYDTLKFETYTRGRSAAYFIFETAKRKKVNVFLKDFCEMVPQMKSGCIDGYFTYVKRGENYGVAMITLMNDSKYITV